MHKGRIMKKTRVMFILMFLLFLSLFMLSQEKKLKVISEKASIYLTPEKGSPIIETIDKGAVLTLLSPEKIREFWYYVSFHSEEKFITLSGFVYSSKVEKMFEIPKSGEKKRLKQTDEGEEFMYASAKKIQVILENANLRAKPNFKSEIIQQIRYGITLLAVGKMKEWYRVDLPPDEEGIIISGYIHQSLVKEIREKIG